MMKRVSATHQRHVLTSSLVTCVTLFVIESLLAWLYRTLPFGRIIGFFDHVLTGVLVIAIFVIGTHGNYGDQQSWEQRLRRLPRVTIVALGVMFVSCLLWALDRTRIRNLRGSRMVMPPISHSWILTVLVLLVSIAAVYRSRVRRWARLVLLTLIVHLLRDCNGNNFRGKGLSFSPFPVLPAMPYFLYMLIVFAAPYAVFVLKTNYGIFRPFLGTPSSSSSSSDSLLPTTAPSAKSFTTPVKAPSSEHLASVTPMTSKSSFTPIAPYQPTYTPSLSSRTTTSAFRNSTPMTKPYSSSTLNATTGPPDASSAYDRALQILAEQGVYMKKSS